MNTNALTKATNQLVKTLNRNSPSILTGLGVAGFITTVVLAVKATPKAMSLIEEQAYAHYKSDRADRNGGTFQQYLDEHKADNVLHIPVLSMKEIVLETWKCYLPATLVGTASIACVIGANSINLQRNAALASLYSIATTTAQEYQKKVVEQIGANKEEKIRDEIAQDHLKKDPIEGKAILITSNGDTLCYDAYSGRYFRGDIETIRKVQNDFNAKILNGELELKLNDLYYELHLPPVDVGNQMGWSITDTLDIAFSAKIASNGQPCIVITFKNLPTHMWDF